MKICRFAPSPTGFLHVGNIRAAIINYLYIQKTGGNFLLRLDDTDTKRVKDEYRQGILEDMAWLGLNHNELFKQSDNLARYEEAKNKLIESGRLYECFESPEELALQRKVQTSSGMKPIYDRAALNLTTEQKENYKKQGIKPHYRFLLEDKIISWDDKIKGQITYEGRHFSDPVLVRDNGVPTYTFCSVVDDIDLKITDIIRGEDHITNTAIQIQIFEALNAKSPDFSHLALIQAAAGKISKREGGFDVKSLRQKGYEPLTLLNFLAQVGTSKSIEIYKNIDELINNFNFNNFSKSSTKYDILELNNINPKLLQKLDFTDVKIRLKSININYEINERFWNIIKLNINFLHEIEEWIAVFYKDFSPQIADENKEFLKEIINHLPNDTKDPNCWSLWLEQIKKNTDRKGRNLFMPIRLALSGKENGPELKNIINLLEKDQIISRLSS